MANSIVSLGVGDVPALELWKTPAPVGEFGGNAPWGQATHFTGDTGRAIAAVDAANEVQYSLALTWPKNWVYRLVEARLLGTFVSTTDASEVSTGWTLRNVDLGKVVQNPFLAQLKVSEVAFPSAFTSVTLNVTKPWLMGELPGSPFGPGGTSGASADQPATLAFLFNTSSNATAAWNLQWYFRCLLYSVEQANHYGMHLSSPITRA